MKYFRFARSLALLIAGMCVALPVSSYADRKVKVYRDLDGDGHYNKKVYDRGDRGYRRYSGNYYRGSRGYYPGYGYRSGYRRSYPYYYGPSLGVSVYSRPTYYSTRTVYEDVPSSSYSYEDSLAVDVQRALRRRGYYSGPVDGDIGPGSRSAIRAYQADRGLPVTGRIDSSLLRALGIG